MFLSLDRSRISSKRHADQYKNEKKPLTTLFAEAQGAQRPRVPASLLAAWQVRIVVAPELAFNFRPPRIVLSTVLRHLPLGEALAGHNVAMIARGMLAARGAVLSVLRSAHCFFSPFLGFFPSCAP